MHFGIRSLAYCLSAVILPQLVVRSELGAWLHATVPEIGLAAVFCTVFHISFRLKLYCPPSATLRWWATGSIVMYAAAVSYGAPILWQKDGIVTLFWAMVQSSIAGSELSQSFAASLSQRRKHGIHLRHVYAGDGLGSVIGASLGAWAGAIPGPYDWNTEWQVWPICSTYCALLGHVVGGVIAAFLPLHLLEDQLLPPHELVD